MLWSQLYRAQHGHEHLIAEDTHVACQMCGILDNSQHGVMTPAAAISPIIYHVILSSPRLISIFLQIESHLLPQTRAPPSV